MCIRDRIYPYPQVSIAIVNLNGKEFLSDCLLSIKEINYPKDVYKRQVLPSDIFL